MQYPRYKIVVKEIDDRDLMPGEAENEIDILRLIASPNNPDPDSRNLVTFYDYQIDHREDKTSIFMLYCKDGNLYDFMTENFPIREEDIRIIMFQLLTGILYMHQRGVIHRDLKPQNILLNNGIYDIRIADFGLSKILAPQTCQNTILRDRVGTSVYMAPEVKNGNYGCECDLWSLGVILFFLITLNQYGGYYVINDDYLQIQDKLSSRNTSMPPSYHISKDCIELLFCLLNTDPKFRYTAFEALHSKFIHPLLSREFSDLDVDVDDRFTVFKYSEMRHIPPSLKSRQYNYLPSSLQPPLQPPRPPLHLHHHPHPRPSLSFTSVKQATKQASYQASNQASKLPSKQPSKQASKLPSKQPSKQASKQPSKQASKKVSKQSSKQASKLSSKQHNHNHIHGTAN